MQNQQLETFIKNYVQAVDSQDLEKAGLLMHTHFRIMLQSNRDSGNVTVLAKNDYLGLMTEKKVGGLKRTVQIQSINWFAGGANVFLTLENEKMQMDSVYSIINDGNAWKILSDLLLVTFKN